jgi:hypothetical protein
MTVLTAEIARQIARNIPATLEALRDTSFLIGHPRNRRENARYWRLRRAGSLRLKRGAERRLAYIALPMRDISRRRLFT